MEHPDIPWRLLRILSLAIIYDFMSFCAQLLRDALQMRAEEFQTRANVAFTLKSYRSNAQFSDQIVFFLCNHQQHQASASSTTVICIKDKSNHDIILTYECHQQRELAQRDN